jgi:ribosomal protein L16/L10AE
MGKGKGAFSHWAVKVNAGTVIFEVYGVSQNIAITAFKTGGAKLPVKTMILV